MEKKTPAQIEAEKKQRAEAITLAEKAYKDFEVKEPTDLQKSFDLLKAVLELKGAENVKNFEEKIAAIEAAAEEAKTAKQDEIAAIKSDLDVTIKAFDKLQTRVKTQGNQSQPETKSFSELLAEGITEAKDSLGKLASEKGKVSFSMKAVADMTFPVNFSTAGASVTYVRPGIIELPKRKLHIRELLPGGSMGAKSTFDFVKEVAGDGTITTVNEATLKPQIDLKLVEASVKAQWIAGCLTT